MIVFHLQVLQKCLYCRRDDLHFLDGSFDNRIRGQPYHPEVFQDPAFLAVIYLHHLDRMGPDIQTN